MSGTKIATYKQVLKALREHAHPLLPVRVIRRKGLIKTGFWGTTELKLDLDGKPESFLIVLEASMSEPGLSEILIHEWAHCVGWTTVHGCLKDHGHEFAHAYERSWRAVEAVL